MEVMNRVGTYNFKQDLKNAQDAEELVGRLIEQHWGLSLVEHAEGKFPDWDLRFNDANGVDLTMEVKLDLSCVKTGNIAIEIGRVPYGKHPSYVTVEPAGIATTKADVVAYLVHHQSGQLALHVADQAEYMRMVEEDQKFESFGGDGNRTLNACIEYPVFSACTEIVCRIDDSRYQI